jgi:type II secretory pathway pseudopilin PulG
MNGITKNLNVAAPDREGFAMVTTMLVVLVLSVLAVGVAWLASTEKKTSYAESVHVQSVFAADAGGEAAVNFLRTSESPPIPLDANQTVRNQGTTNLTGSQNFDYSAQFLQAQMKPGWDPTKYRDFEYRVQSHGTAASKGDSDVEMVVGRLYQIGY